MRRNAVFVVVASCAAMLWATGTAFAAPPLVAIDPSPTSSYTSAEVSGEIDPDDREIFWFFQYSKDPAGEGWSLGPGAFSQTLPAGDPATPVASVLTELTPGAEYQVRLVAVPTDFSEGETFSAEPNPTFTTAPVGQPTVALDPVTAVSGTTAHFSGSIDPEAPAGDPEAFDVDWHFECTPQCAGVDGGQIEADSSSHVVEVEAEGLEPNTDYEVTLVASNAGGPVSDGPRSFSTDAVEPFAQTLYAGQLEETSATLAGWVNPRNSAVEYRFEWGSDSSYGNSAPASPQSLSFEDNSFHVVTAPVSGLDPGTTYHFRVVAEGPAGSAEGADHTFTTSEPAPAQPPCANEAVRIQQGVTRLPDCRAYEKVSPADKNGYDVIPRPYFAAAADGDAVAFKYNGPAPETDAGAITAQNLGRRSADGWSFENIDPPAPAGSGLVPRFQLFSDDLSYSLVNAFSALVPGAKERSPQLYRRAEDGSFDLLSAASPEPSPFSGDGGEKVTGVSADFGQVMFDSKFNQTGEAVTGEVNSYIWDNGTLRLVGVMDDGTIPESGSAGGVAGGTAPALSRDGDRAVFRIFSSVSNGGQLYLREDDGVAPPRTVHVSRSQRTDCAVDPTCGGDLEPDPAPDPAGPQAAFFSGLEAEHGGSVLFTSCEKLTDDSGATSEVDPGACSSGVAEEVPGQDLYLFDLATEEVTDLTPAESGRADVLGVVAYDEALTRIYFVARGILAGQTGPVQGAPNLYLWDRGDTSFIATLDDAGESAEQGDIGVPDFYTWSSLRDRRAQAVRVTPDGSVLSFVSRAPLTSYDNRNPAACLSWVEQQGGGTANPEGRCAEVYRYDANTAELICASCDALGGATGNVSLRVAFSSDQGGNTEPFVRNLSADGRHLFFMTPDRLVGADTNGKLDVYDWRAGEPVLISSGRSSFDTTFFDADVDGSDVFLITKDQLTAGDGDANTDLYDARAGGGFGEPIEAPACEGDACLIPPVVPNDQTPASSGFSGATVPSPAKKRAQAQKKKKQQRKKKKRKRKQRAHRDGRAGR